MTLESIASKRVITVTADATLQRAAQLMREAHVGDLIVVKNHFLPIGIITDRDIVVSTTAFGISPNQVTVGEVMTPTFFTAKSDDDIDEILHLMKEHGIRRVPMVNPEGLLTGIVTLDDITTFLASKLNEASKVFPRQRAMETKHRPNFSIKEERA